MANERKENYSANEKAKNQFIGMSDQEIRVYRNRKRNSDLKLKMEKCGGRDKYARKNGLILR